MLSSFEHEEIREAIERGECPPHDEGAFESWWSGLSHVRMLQRNAHEQGELIVAALSRSVFVHAAVVSADHPGLDDHDGLLKWNCGLYSQQALTRSWVMTRDEIIFEPYVHEWGTDALSGFPLVYGRCFEGLDEPEAMYMEVAQDYTHSLDVHWRSERSAYCRFDSRGDWEDVVSITKADSDITLVSFSRDPLDQYLVKHDAVLVQLFEFTFQQPGSLALWEGRVKHGMDRGLSFFQQFAEDGSISQARGVQIVRPRLSNQQVEQRLRKSHGFGAEVETDPPVEFTVWDWRNSRITGSSEMRGE